MTDIASNLDQIYDQVKLAARNSGKDPDGIRVLAVSKTFTSSEIDQAYAWGQRVFGENRVQEAQGKLAELRDHNIEWHLIGHLQSNKARLAAQLFDVIQSVDSEKIAARLNRICHELDKKLRVYIQVNLAGESQKSGVSPENLPSLVKKLDSMEFLELEGLMTLPPYEEEPEKTRPYFRRLYQLFERVNSQRTQPLAELSMGMSHDYRIAIEEGATMVRIGTAIFGRRQR